MRRQRPRCKASERGFSLIELLVSVAIIIILMAIILYFLSATQQNYRTQQAISSINQGGRSAMDVMTTELNQAGYNPAPSIQRSISTVGAVPLNPGSPVVSMPLTDTSSNSLKTRRIFYGTRLVIGNSCAGVCDQEEVTVNMDKTLSTTGITSTTVPVVLNNSHANGEPVFIRNYPFPNGIIYDNRSAGTGLGIASNRIRFFGDVLNTGDLYYEEYRLRCPGSSAGSYIDACTTGCMTGPFVLTRFITKLADPSTGAFKIPASRAAALDGATASPLVTNIQGECASTAGVTWPVTVNDETSSTSTTAVNNAIDYSSGTPVNIDPVMNMTCSNGTGACLPLPASCTGTCSPTPALWLKMNTYGAYDPTTTPPTPYFSSYVTDVDFTLTVQEATKDPVTGNYRTVVLNDHIVPRNVMDALGIATNGGAALLPEIPTDPTNGNTLPLP